MTRRGFTIVELIITITIMGILLTLAVVNISSTQVNARDDKRKADIEAIGNNLESFYTAGVSSGSGVPVIVNEVTNPSFEVDTSSWLPAGTGATLAKSNEQAYSGAYSVKITPSSSNTYSGMYTSAPGTNGVQYTYTAYVYSTSPQLINFAADGYFASTELSVGPVWQKISITGTRVNSNGIYVRAVTASGTPYYVDGVSVTQGPTLYNFGDGSFPDWSWTGIANNSTSTGYAIKLNSPGTYPSTSITSSPLLKKYLLDADLKSFTAPGQTDPYSTFVRATNAVQSPSGVLPQPTINQYVYQPIDSNGNVCYNYDCRKYNLYYRLEKDNTVYMVTSKSQ